MDYYEFTLRLKIPRPRNAWFRYRLRLLLFLMVLVAIVTTVWHVRSAGFEQQLYRRLEQSKAERDAALLEWKLAVGGLRAGQETARKEELNARAKYFRHRAEIEAVLQRIAATSN